MGHPSVHYRLYSPGEPKTLLNQNQAKNDFDSEAFEEAVYVGCAEDGLKALDDDFTEERGFDTIAMFLKKATSGRSKKKPDYHFATYVGGNHKLLREWNFENSAAFAPPKDLQWLSKVPFKPYEFYTDVSEIKAATGYAFAGYFLAPVDVAPRCFSNAILREVSFQSDGKTVVMDEIINPMSILNPVGFGFVLDPDLSVAFRIGGEDYEQMPPLPEYPNPVNAEKSIYGLNKYLSAGNLYGKISDPSLLRLMTAETDRKIALSHPNPDALKSHLATYGDLKKADWKACETICAPSSRNLKPPSSRAPRRSDSPLVPT